MPFVRVCTLCYRRLQLKNKINLLVAICCLAVLEVSFGREDWQCGSQCHSGFASGCGGDGEFSTSHPTWFSQNAAHSKVTGLYTLHKVLQQNLKCSLTDPSSGSFHWPPGVGFLKDTLRPAHCVLFTLRPQLGRVPGNVPDVQLFPRSAGHWRRCVKISCHVAAPTQQENTSQHLLVEHLRARCKRDGRGAQTELFVPRGSYHLFLGIAQIYVLEYWLQMGIKEIGERIFQRKNCSFRESKQSYSLTPRANRLHWVSDFPVCRCYYYRWSCMLRSDDSVHLVGWRKSPLSAVAKVKGTFKPEEVLAAAEDAC